MTDQEREMLRAAFDLSDGQLVLVPFDEIAVRLGTSITATRTLAALLGSRKLAIVTFGGIQLTNTGLAEAKVQYAD